MGLAIAAKLSPKHNVVVVEQEKHFGEHSSSRNSEVIHAGLYYPTDSLKAKLCVQGKQLLYEHCKTYNVPHKNIGKLLVAQDDDETQKLEDIYQQSHLNGVNDLQWLTQSGLSNKVPYLSIQAGLWSPSTGIIDSHQYLLSLLHVIEQNHGHYVPNTKFVNAKPVKDGLIVTLEMDESCYQIRCSHLINAGGLFASDNAKRIDDLDLFHIPETLYCRGQYFAYHGKHPFNTLIYPVPEKHGLGIHATLDMFGKLKFGPDTQFIDNLDYATDHNVKDKFVTAIRRYWPRLDDSKLHIDYSGIRPKLQIEGVQDFIVQDNFIHGLDGLINLFGIESPGLTASLALAEYVCDKIVRGDT